MAKGKEITISPSIAGLEWISSSQGDFCFGDCLVEVKCTNKNFSAGDYRQTLLYWLLNFTFSLSNPEMQPWKLGIIFNPRKNKYVQVNFEELHRLVAGGRNVIETVELLQIRYCQLEQNLSSYRTAVNVVISLPNMLQIFANEHLTANKITVLKYSYGLHYFRCID